MFSKSALDVRWTHTVYRQIQFFELEFIMSLYISQVSQPLASLLALLAPPFVLLANTASQPH